MRGSLFTNDYGFQDGRGSTGNQGWGLLSVGPRTCAHEASPAHHRGTGRGIKCQELSLGADSTDRDLRHGPCHLWEPRLPRGAMSPSSQQCWPPRCPWQPGTAASVWVGSHPLSGSGVQGFPDLGQPRFSVLCQTHHGRGGGRVCSVLYLQSSA